MVQTRRKTRSAKYEKTDVSNTTVSSTTSGNGTGDSIQNANSKVSYTPTVADRKTATKKDEPRFFRKCLSSLKYLALLIVIPPFLNYAALNQEEQKLMPDGALFDIGFGQKLFMSCIGEGTPTVILDAPTGASSDVWALIQPDVGKLTKVCVYDRAGLGFSERPHRNVSYETAEDGEEKIESNFNTEKNKWQEFTVERMADDLHRLVTYSSQQMRPFIMVSINQ